MPREYSPCKGRTRRVPNTIALQRNWPVGSGETLLTGRYAPSGDPDVPCLPTEGAPGSRCFAEHSTRRKTCRWLAPADDYVNLFRPGLYLWGLPPFDTPDAPLFCDKGRLDDDETPFEHFVLGPYAVGNAKPPRLRVKCIDFALVFESFDNPDNVVLRFQVNDDKYTPSVEMMTAFAAQLETHMRTIPSTLRGAARNAVACAQTLRARTATLKGIRTRCAQSPELERTFRLILRNTFFLAMYMRRWAGPGTAYPISQHETKRLVGRQYKPISDALVGKTPVVSRIGEVSLREWRPGNQRADTVKDGKADAMMDTYMRALHTCIEEANPRLRETLRAGLPLASDNPTTDGSFWPMEKTLWECVFGREQSIATGDYCIRLYSNTLLNTCRMLLPYAYKSVPTWARYEGFPDQVQ